MEDTVAEKTEKKLPDVKTEEVIKKMTSDLTEFHFVADWLTNKEVLFVEKDENVYYLKAFNIKTGEITVLFEESSIIVNVLVHQSKEKLLLHTTNNPDSGIVKIISLDGVVEHEVTIESSELEIEWNDTDPSLILFTAFYEDWTYEVFLFDGIENDVRVFPLEDPFPKWLGTDKIVSSNISDYSLDGGELYLHDRNTGKRQLVNESGVIHYDTYQESLLLMQIKEEEEAEYKILSQDLSTVSTWKMPVMRTDSYWMIPEVHWLTNEQVILTGVQNEQEEVYELVKVTGDEQVVLADEVAAGPIRCSPDGQKCLTSFAFEKLIDFKLKKEIIWLILIE